ncbi:MAG: tetratricopeptide repeat protein [Deltaproteobacteria bacterium]|nr:tetratricopeptide repeat protein [Deltaproteobacteria bacterium]
MRSEATQNRSTNLLVVIVIVLLTTAVYSQVRSHGFIGYDDDIYVTDNMHVKNGLTPGGFQWAFSTSTAGNWHPLTWLSHQLDVQLFGMQPGAHHLVNLLLHIINAVLLYFLWLRMTGARWKSFFVAALFAVHPLHVESVAWIAERKDVLSGFFWMATLWSYVWYTERRGGSAYLLVHLCLGMGLMAKPMLVTLPFVLLLLDYWPLKRLEGGGTGADSRIPAGRPLFTLVREKTGLFVLVLAVCLVTVYAQSIGGNVGFLQTYPLVTRLANALVVYVAYILKFLWPVNLAVLYPHPGMPPLWKIGGAALMLAAMTTAAVQSRRKRPWMLVGWLWFLGTLVPVIGLVQVGVQSMADRYTYIPMVGLLVMAAWGVPDLFPAHRWRDHLLFPAALAAVVALSVAAWHQIGYWSNSITLFRHAVEVTEDNYIMHNNLGFELKQAGRTDEARAHYLKAIAINPKFAEAHLNLGVLLAEEGRHAAADARYREALRIDPGYVQAHLNLGNSRLRQGYAGDALKQYADALKLDPESADAYNGLGAAMVKTGKYAQAALCFQKALNLDPGHAGARNNLKKIQALLKEQ